MSKYDGYILKAQPLGDIETANISSISIDNRGAVWIGTENSGLFKLEKSRAEKIDGKSSPLHNISALTHSTHNLFLISNKSLYKLSDKETISRINVGSDNIAAITINEFNEIFIATDSKIFLLKNINDSLTTKAFLNIEKLPEVKEMRWFDKTLYLGTRKGLYTYNNENKKIKDLSEITSNANISSITRRNGSIFLGTFKHGIIELKGKERKNYKYISPQLYSVPDNIITSIIVDNTDTLWAGTYNAGLTFVPLTKTKFKHLNQSNLPCLKNPYITSYFNYKNHIILGTQEGVVKYNLETNKCSEFRADLPEGVKYLAAYGLTAHKNHLYVSTQIGLFAGDINENFVTPVSDVRSLTYEAIKHFNNIYFTTNIGVFKYNFLTKSTKKIPIRNSTKQTIFKGIAALDDKLFFISKEGIGVLNQNSINIIQKQIKPSAILTNGSSIWVANSSKELIELDQYGNILQSLPLNLENKQSITSLAKDENGNLWFSSLDGLNFLNPKSNKIKRLSISEGFLSDSYHFNTLMKLDDSRFAVSSKKGLTIFHPEDIKDNLVPPKVALTKLTRFNEEVVPGEDYEGFSIDTPVEYLDELEIGHRDYVIGFEFAGLHYADPMHNQYQYMLEGFHEDWVSTDAKNRTATFTNLNPGDYVFRVKAANKDGIWSLDEDNVALKITVHPAPWLSWWAFTIYGLVILGSILWFIRYRTQAAIARSRELEEEVSLRTQEIETQKNVIESLLERKNELFANISHEFRTPLTLILGPLEKELKALDSPKNPKHLQMIQRNATRLLGMVEQILKLTELKKEESVNKVPYAVNPALEAIVDSFESLAESKRINLSLMLDEQANILAANDALEVMVGNLISNAIKYTPNGGKVSVTSKHLNNRIQICVTDTGVGMTQKQQEEVFERFVRLDKTSDIAGTGIGLSIVKELILAHDGQVVVDSTEGQGSTFTITLPTTEQAVLTDNHSVKSIEHLTHNEVSTDSTDSSVASSIESESPDTQQELILIIDDNPDMRDYIQEVLSPHYHCLTADRGEAGIELAQAEVPDLIISDIMMPGIDGYEVARRLREDIITSHIPLILLTAKGDKESRIQGWNENIDDYMTKPFDEEELKARVNNIIDIRNILSRKAGLTLETSTDKSPQTNKSDIQQSPENETRTLNKKEQAFVDKLMKIIEENYQKPDFQRKDMADLMFVSDRQLNRKIRALLNTNPVALLQNAKLNKACELLKEGEKVNLISDCLGFSSPSYFIKCFRSQFGVTPKQFQTERATQTTNHN